MKTADNIIHVHLKKDGGVYRPLPLLTLSCCGYGYGTLVRTLTGMTYGPIGGIGTVRGWQTLFDIQRIVKNFDQKLALHGWFRAVRTQSYRRGRAFGTQLDEHAAYAASNPAQCILWILREYPRYLACIGVYNLFWRYTEFATSSMRKLPVRDMRLLADERNDLAHIYPRCEKVLLQALRRIAPMYRISARLLLMMTRDELRRTVVGRRLTVSATELEARSRGYIYYFQNGKEYVDSRTVQIKKVRTYLDTHNQLLSTALLLGTPVSPGTAQGTVITSLNVKKIPRFPIFVTEMVHPKDVAHMKRLTALVTDEGGGMLSHAAIVARELNIPCLVGTRHATRMFKDGDRVEVDAIHGTVKKLK
ncbi:MAG: PEP-utilizing enzyme [Patescibacteria group bacterium]